MGLEKQKKMLNYLWGFMIIFGIFIGIINGKIDLLGTAAINSSKEAITLCITMTGVMALWMGMMQIAKVSGMIDGLTKGIRPLIRILFPDIPVSHIVNEYIATNMIANLLGLGWAATPMGLKAMEQLAELNENKKIASVDMCTFLIINISSLQLIPVNVIAYRSQYGSINPTEILGAAIVATAISTTVGIIFSVMARKFVLLQKKE